MNNNIIIKAEFIIANCNIGIRLIMNLKDDKRLEKYFESFDLIAKLFEMLKTSGNKDIYIKSIEEEVNKLEQELNVYPEIPQIKINIENIKDNI
ncbi:MAG: hypothetical protein HRU03_00935 [Nanoarchaeales archaeon]|nr:hypothetical protein [Nanoarchaeales archaeon]